MKVQEVTSLLLGVAAVITATAEVLKSLESIHIKIPILSTNKLKSNDYMCGSDEEASSSDKI